VTESRPRTHFQGIESITTLLTTFSRIELAKGRRQLSRKRKKTKVGSELNRSHRKVETTNLEGQVEQEQVSRIVRTWCVTYRCGCDRGRRNA